jgi:hypothetical protein
MTPDEKGAFCGSCKKSVYDFTNKTDEEVTDILMKANGAKICGRFNAEQLERPIELSLPVYNLPQNVSPFRAFAMAAFLVFGTILFTCQDANGQVVGKMKITYPQEQTQTKNNTQTSGTSTISPRQVMGGPKYTPQQNNNENKPVTKTPQTLKTPKEDPNKYARMGDVVCTMPLKGEIQIDPVQDTVKPETKHPVKKDTVQNEPPQTILMGKPSFNKVEKDTLEQVTNDQVKPMTFAPVPDPIIRKPIKYQYLGQPVISTIKVQPGDTTKNTEQPIVVKTTDTPQTLNIPKSIQHLTDTSATVKNINPDKTINTEKKAISLEVMPNPSTGKLTLRYSIKEKNFTTLELFDISGTKVRSFVSYQQVYEGTYTTTFDISDLPDGIYICALRSGDKTASSKVILTK